MLLPGEHGYTMQNTLVLPYTNCVVAATVEYICYAHVVVKITHVEGRSTVPVQGVLHREDSMYGIKDSDKLNELFSPGDRIYARVLSLGDTGSIVLSTTDEAHGVYKAMDYTTQKEIRMAQGTFVHNGQAQKRKTAKI